jgi:5,10-methylenetetrahydromethanopterin reductase
MMIPSLRHVVTNAVAAATLHGLAPGRVVIGVGTGLTSRRLMGQPAMRWSEVTDYVRRFRQLLRDETAEVDGRAVRLCHPAVQKPSFPLELPVLPAVVGPVGIKAALAMGADGIVSPRAVPPEFDWIVRPLFGTVLDPGESPTSERVIAAAGPGAAVLYHLLYDSSHDIDGLPGGLDWRTALEALPVEERAVAHWKGHLVHLSDLDRAYIPVDAIPQLTTVATAEEVAARIAAMAGEGITEVALHPAGDIPDELRRFANAARIAAVG